MSKTIIAMPAWMRPRLMLPGAGLLLVCVLSIPLAPLFASAVPPADPSGAVAGAPAGPAGQGPSWRMLGARHAGFDLDAPRWRPLGLSVSVLRRTDGVARDLFVFGSAAGLGRYAALAVDRGGRGSDLRREAAALAADLGVEARLRDGQEHLDAKFGPLAAADMQISGEGGPRACLAFAFRPQEAALRFVGWICNAGEEVVSRAAATCFVDRLFAVGAGDPKAAALFARAELERRCDLTERPAGGWRGSAERTPLRLRRL